MRVLITGSEGFAGSHLVEYSLAQGDEVWGTCAPGAKVTNLSHLLDQITLRVGDLTQPEFIHGVLNETRFDVLYHLAAVSFVPNVERAPARAYEINVLSGIHVLEAVRTAQPDVRVVMASSAEVYGALMPEDMPIVEKYPFAPANIFAAGKAALELVASPFIKSYGVNATIARPFNHTGPRQRPDFVCSTFALQVAEVETGREPVIKVGDLSPKRDFSDVRDMVRGYRLLGLHGERGEAYNLASGTSVSVEHILHTLVQMARVKVDIVTDPLRVRKTQVMDVSGSYEKIHKLCGWQPEIPLERTLRDLLNWHRDNLLNQQKLKK